MLHAVEKILAGEFNREKTALEFSSPRIELTLRPGERREGSFFIYGPQKQPTEGTVTSDRLRMQCLTPHFSGAEEEIGYRADASDMEEGERLTGEFCIISNHGEYSIPYEITVAAADMESSLGGIRNLFHFTNLARTNWEEAVTLFYSPKFARIFRGADQQYETVYRGLSGGSQSEQNVEEFLLEIRKKQKVEFLPKEKEIHIDNPGASIEYTVTVNRNGWGYSELSVEAEGDFLILQKEKIRDEDFLGNCCRLPFYIAQDKLHGGRNYGSLRFFNAYTSFRVPVVAHQVSARTRVPGLLLRKQHLTVDLMLYYEAFRTKKIEAALWMQETEKVLDQLEEADRKDVNIRLLRAQLLITQEREKEAAWLLEQADTILEENFDPEGYCYYLYLTTLLQKDGEYIDETAAQVERIFAQNSDSWRIAWLLLYLSEDYSRSPSRKWVMLEDQFKKGCSSPVLYIEAYNLLSSNPTLLLHLDSFELQVLAYAARKELLSAGVIQQIVYLAGRQKQYLPRIYELLKKCYELIPDDETLQAICTLLIKGNRTGPEPFTWYARGIEKELRITRLYEYYMMSCELSDQLEIPKMVLMYFAFDSNLDSLHNAFLYAYMHKNRQNYPELYETYREQIERFAVFQILKGRNNEWLAYLYRNIVTPVMITEETAKGLAVALFIHRLKIRRKDIRKVVLVYEKVREPQEFSITGFDVYLPVYGSDCRVFLEDAAGNRFCREENYELERLMIPDKLAHMAAPYVTDEISFDVWQCERGRALAAVNESNAAQMRRVADSEVLMPALQKEIRLRLLHFFFDQDKMTELDSFLQELTPEQIAGNACMQVIRFLILRGMYEKAYSWICSHGGYDLEPKLIMRLCSRLLSMEIAQPDQTLTTLVFMAFQAGKYDEVLLNYLIRYYEGPCRRMQDIFTAARAFGVETYELDRRILTQILYSGAYVGGRTEIFRDYIAGGAADELEAAFLSQSCFEYFVEDKAIDDFIMQALQRRIERQEEISLVCKLAYTRYYAENKKQIRENHSRCLVRFLRELLAEKLYFPYFKEYVDHIAFMRQFADKTMLQYRKETEGSAVIHYLFEKENGSQSSEYINEELPDLYYGICVKQFVLFFGEKLPYYITEQEGDQEKLTESGALSRADTDREQKESKYSLINDIAIGRTLGDDDTMGRLLREYYEQEFMVQKLFHMI